MNEHSNSGGKEENGNVGGERNNSDPTDPLSGEIQREQNSDSCVTASSQRASDQASACPVAPSSATIGGGAALCYPCPLCADISVPEVLQFKEDCGAKQSEFPFDIYRALENFVQQRRKQSRCGACLSRSAGFVRTGVPSLPPTPISVPSSTKPVPPQKKSTSSEGGGKVNDQSQSGARMKDTNPLHPHRSAASRPTEHRGSSRDSGSSSSRGRGGQRPVDRPDQARGPPGGKASKGDKPASKTAKSSKQYVTQTDLTAAFNNLARILGGQGAQVGEPTAATSSKGRKDPAGSSLPAGEGAGANQAPGGSEEPRVPKQLSREAKIRSIASKIGRSLRACPEFANHWRGSGREVEDLNRLLHTHLVEQLSQLSDDEVSRLGVNPGESYATKFQDIILQLYTIAEDGTVGWCSGVGTEELLRRLTINATNMGPVANWDKLTKWRVTIPSPFPERVDRVQFVEWVKSLAPGELCRLLRLPGHNFSLKTVKIHSLGFKGKTEGTVAKLTVFFAVPDDSAQVIPETIQSAPQWKSGRVTVYITVSPNDKEQEFIYTALVTPPSPHSPRSFSPILYGRDNDSVIDDSEELPGEDDS